MTSLNRRKWLTATAGGLASAAIGASSADASPTPPGPSTLPGSPAVPLAGDVAALGLPGRAEGRRLRFVTGGTSGAWLPLRPIDGGPDHLQPAAMSDLVAVPDGATGYELDGSTGTRLSSPAASHPILIRSSTTRRRGNQEITRLRVPRSAPLSVVSRKGWGADESWRLEEDGAEAWTRAFRQPQALTVHHSVMDLGDGISTLQAIYRFHAVENGWTDIGYHLLIDSKGVVYQGRFTGDDAPPVFEAQPRPGFIPRSVTAGHAYGFNPGNIGVCLLGDFTDVTPTAKAWDAVVTVLAGLSRITGIDAQSIVHYTNPDTGNTNTAPGVSRHRDWTSTECPGNAFAPKFDLIRAEVAARASRH